jgi:hypothetical protein
MDETDMEEEGKNRKRKWWGIEIKMYFFGIVIFMFMYNNCNQESEKPVGQIKIYVYVTIINN